jgi:TRAP-type transport system periplasmic protein
MFNRLSSAAIAAAMVVGLSSPVLSETKWDVSIPWGASEFHTKDAVAFAAAVKEATGGEVVMTIHTGGSLGVRHNESLRAIEDGLVAMGEFAAFVNVGDVPILGVESIPFLISNYADLRIMQDIVRPTWEAELMKRNQKMLYSVPWPSQNFFTKKKIETEADMKGIRMRTYDANTATMVSNLGMVALQLNSADVVPALATGKVDAVMTSGSTAVAQKYWEFLKHTYNTNHLWASNVMNVNLDMWKALSPAHQKAIEDLAHKMERDFWVISEAEHKKRMAQLVKNGMTVQAASPALQAAMVKATSTMEADFIKRVGGKSAEIIAAYRKRAGK